MKKVFLTLVMGVSALALVISCKHEMPGQADTGNSQPAGNNNPPTASTCSADTVYFQQEVLPIFISNCSSAGCHDATSHQKGIVLTSYNSIMNNGGIRAGNPGNSKIYKKITEDDREDRMPPLPRNVLPQTQIDIIGKWIMQGAKNNSCELVSCNTSNVNYNGTIRSIISAKCQGCHSGSAAAGGLDYSNYEGVKAKVNDGKLSGAVNHVAGFSPMPKNGNKLSSCELSQIKKWIDDGAPNN